MIARSHRLDTDEAEEKEIADSQPCPPITIRDEHFTRDAPLQDRHVLCMLVAHLTERVRADVAKHVLAYQCHPTRLVLFNTPSPSQTASGCRRFMAQHIDRFKIPLPTDAICWSEVAKVDIELQLLSVLAGIPSDYVWRHVYLKLDCFIDDDTRQEVERELDDGQQENQPQEQQQVARPQPPPSTPVVAPPPQPRLQQPAPQSQRRASQNPRIDTPRAPIRRPYAEPARVPALPEPGSKQQMIYESLTETEDSEDDIQIIYQSPTK